MSPIVPILLQGLVLVLLYLFVWRVGRAALREVRGAGPPVITYAEAEPAATKAPTEAPTKAGGAARGRRGAARPDRVPPRELVVHHDGQAPEVVALDGRTVALGRSAEGVRIDDPYASDRHARIEPDGEEYVLRDLGSTNGTFLNAVRLSEPARLAAGDQIGVGDTVVEVRR